MIAGSDEAFKKSEILCMGLGIRDVVSIEH